MIEVANLGNYRAIEDWWFILPSILLVDVVMIFLSRYLPNVFGKPINDWYDDFGLAAVLSDVTIIAIGIAIARYIYSVFFMEQEGWSMIYFLALAVLVQLIHDVFFAAVIVNNIPKGHNSMMDIFKDYIKGGPAILVVDAGMIAGSIVLAAFLKQYDYHYTGSLTLVTLYTLTYILYTNVNFKKAN
jgi:hypothetical protein